MQKTVDFTRLQSHPLALMFHQLRQTVEALGCGVEFTSALNQISVLSDAVEAEINRMAVVGDVTDDMLNEGQERMCQMSSRTCFEDHIQSEVYKAMRSVDPAAQPTSPA